MENRVVITGLGPAAPFCIGKDSLSKMLNSQDFTKCKRELKEFDFSSFCGTRENANTRGMDRISKYAVLGAKLALEDASILLSAEDSENIGVIIGSAFGCTESSSKFIETLIKKGPRLVNPLIYRNTVSNAASGQIALVFGLKGFHSTINSGNVSSADAAAYSFELIKRGKAEVILSGGVETFSPASYLWFDFSDYFFRKMSLTEGAGILVLESLAHAEIRGANIYAEIIGTSILNAGANKSVDALAAAIRRGVFIALKESGITMDDLDGFILNNTLEPVELRSILGYDNKPAYSFVERCGNFVGASGAFDLMNYILFEAKIEKKPHNIALINIGFDGSIVVIISKIVV
ncbi:MAG: 3-oxoacyl-(acyl-carrier-protein) synthase 2 [candidate division WS2 bacterium]|nr:3-oxoacyl-(acyl-carrier-protein) synthase 2 [Candidatus Lithacetigena glycinireducens]